MHRKLNEAELGSLKIGSIVTRIMSGIENEVMVNKITPELITVVTTDSVEKVNREVVEISKLLGFPDPPQNILPQWDFDPKTGLEIDEDITNIQKELGWPPLPVSYLAKKIE